MYSGPLCVCLSSACDPEERSPWSAIGKKEIGYLNFGEQNLMNVDLRIIVYTTFLSGMQIGVTGL